MKFVVGTRIHTPQHVALLPAIQKFDGRKAESRQQDEDRKRGTSCCCCCRRRCLQHRFSPVVAEGRRGIRKCSNASAFPAQPQEVELGNGPGGRLSEGKAREGIPLQTPAQQVQKKKKEKNNKNNERERQREGDDGACACDEAGPAELAFQSASATREMRMGIGWQHKRRRKQNY